MTAVARSDRQLSELAKLRGVQLGYTGQDGRRVVASRETMLAVLSALGNPITDEQSIVAELERARAERHTHGLEPVYVMRRNGALSGSISVPSALDLTKVWLTIELEAGGTERRSADEVSTQQPTGESQRALFINLGALRIPPGYHRLVLEIGGRRTTALLLAPPKPRGVPVGGLGVFSPVYALRSASDGGIGSYSDLAEFADWVGTSGGNLAGTLPLFASFTQPPMDPSPYLPVSRRFWNDLLIDLGAVPECSQPAPAPVRPTNSRWDAHSVDYDAVVMHKRAVLQRCAETLVSQPSTRRDDFERFVKSDPLLEQYADFRAADEQYDGTWCDWAAAPGELPAGELPASAVRYHRYAQFLATEQISRASERGAGLYLDLPVGVHPDGFDTWVHSTLFAPAGVGAPPDDFFAGGQSWGFPPLHPERLRVDGYRYLIDAYRHVLRYARAIRIDHVLGLQRMFWIPEGASAADGAYVRYPTEELRAVVAIESDRAGAVVVGEDLGVVSPAIRQAMDRDRMLHTFVYQFNASADDPLPQPRKPSMASFGGHDLPKFASYWRGADIDERLEQGDIDAPTAEKDRQDREALIAAIPGPSSASGDDRAVGLSTILGALADGPASYLFVDLADLTFETVPDNRPGTGPEAGNWRRRMSRPLADIAADPTVTTLMSDLVARRAAVVGKE